jgi:DNA topoisomerase-1
VPRPPLGKGFTYIRADGSKLSEAAVLSRIKALAIPPAWADIWICPAPDGHIQATGGIPGEPLALPQWDQ